MLQERMLSFCLASLTHPPYFIFPYFSLINDVVNEKVDLIIIMDRWKNISKRNNQKIALQQLENYGLIEEFCNKVQSKMDTHVQGNYLCLVDAFIFNYTNKMTGIRGRRKKKGKDWTVDIKKQNPNLYNFMTDAGIDYDSVLDSDYSSRNGHGHVGKRAKRFKFTKNNEK